MATVPLSVLLGGVTQFGYLALMSEAPAAVSPSGKSERRFYCQCICGKTSAVRVGHLKSGRSRSCGCVITEARRIARSANVTIHGLSGTPEFGIWQGIKKRCFNQNHRSYPQYGGRGITMAPEWRSDFKAFYDYVGERPTPEHSIDRIDVEGGYCPGNVRWADKSTQLRNRRPFLLTPGGVPDNYVPAPKIPYEPRARTSQRSHGMRNSPEYRTWISMKQRCLCPTHTSYPRYGGMGVMVATEWIDDFEAFITHIGLRPSAAFTLDRIDNDLGYLPGNVRWADRRTQWFNRKPYMVYPKSS